MSQKNKIVEFLMSNLKESEKKFSEFFVFTKDKGPKPLDFQKWFFDFDVDEISFKDYIYAKHKIIYLYNFNNIFNIRFGKAKCFIVERLVDSLKIYGRYNEKMLSASKIVEEAFEIVYLLTGIDPINVLVKAIIRSTPREDLTQNEIGVDVRTKADDFYAQQRVNMAIYKMIIGAQNSFFENLKPISECLADEMINASIDTNDSFLI